MSTLDPGQDAVPDSLPEIPDDAAYVEGVQIPVYENLEVDGEQVDLE